MCAGGKRIPPTCVSHYNEHRILPYKIRGIHTASGCGLFPGDTPEYPVFYEGGKRTKNSKTARLEMRIQPGDKDKIVKAAKRSGISVAEYVLRCCKGHPPKAKPPEQFWELLNELYTVFDELSPEKQEKLAQLILRLQEVL